jgi:hypothetical protein
MTHDEWRLLRYGMLTAFLMALVSRANSPTQHELSEVRGRRHSRRYRFSRLSAVQVHGAPQEIKLSHYPTGA